MAPPVVCRRRVVVVGACYLDIFLKNDLIQVLFDILHHWEKRKGLVCQQVTSGKNSKN